MGKKIVITKRSIWATLLLLIFGLFSWGQLIGYIIPGFREIFSLNSLKDLTVNEIGLIWVPMVSYVLTATLVCLMVNVFKPLRGRNDVVPEIFRWGLRPELICKLIDWDGGLIHELIRGFNTGLILGLIFVPFGLTTGLKTGISLGLIGLTIGLLVGLISGLLDEFK